MLHRILTLLFVPALLTVSCGKEDDNDTDESAATTQSETPQADADEATTTQTAMIQNQAAELSDEQQFTDTATTTMFAEADAELDATAEGESEAEGDDEQTEEVPSVGSRSVDALCQVQINPPADIQPAIKTFLEEDASSRSKLCVGELLKFTFTVRGEQKSVLVGFFERTAPNHVARFKRSAQAGFYDGLAIHRSIKDFMIQGGDPLTRDPANEPMFGTGDPGFMLDQEFSSISHTPGIASTARNGHDVNSGSSQFFLMHETDPRQSAALDNKYTVWGAIVDGYDVVDEIANLPTRPIGNQMQPTPFPQPRVDMMAEVITAEESGLEVIE